QHLFILTELAHRDDGETSIGDSLRSALRECSGKLTFVPAGQKFHGWQKPRVLARILCLYLDPKTSVVSEELGLPEIDFSPRLFFDDHDLRETAFKLKRQVEETSMPLYAEALEMTLVHELIRLDRGVTQNGVITAKGGLAAWQKKRVASYIEENL